MKALRHAQIREYFFGHGEDALAPSSMTAEYADLNIFQIVEGTTPFPLLMWWLVEMMA
jgi:polyribonucleotide 5'-hydroxyl-kinase